MKQYPQIISKLLYEPVVITREKHAAICGIVEARLAAGDAFAADPQKELNKPADAGYGNYGNSGSVSIIPIHGIIGKHLGQMEMMSGGCDLDNVCAMISIAESDPIVTRVIFDFRTPGGSVNGTPEAARKIAMMRKETVAFTDSECCSGGMWLAAQCKQFYITESAKVGSIGVWCAIIDKSKALEKEGVNVQVFSAGKYKTMGAMWKPLSDDEKAKMQARVDKIHADFKEAVQAHRVIADEFMEGQNFFGEEAVAAGLVDGLVDSLDDLI